ncbi:MAG TPA: PP2C family protein-serine/threonine phosphatase [Vicinamibacterales bacterium]|jgi:sigma-B regulation protein RsbU (phosphoserine phosphatase)|nr:PP2C family protein-serine/threonine phosphatase [Vicinamibacterales bacterium]
MSSQAVPPLPRTPGGPHHFFKAYTDGLTTVELERLFTRETPEAYRFFSRHIDHSELKKLPWHRRILAYARVFFLAFTMKLTPARRLIYAAALACIFIGLIELYREMHVFVLPHPAFAPGTMWVLSGFLLVNFLVFVEVADRLTLKNDLEIARDIQQAMLPRGAFHTSGVEAFGMTRPANTVGGDFYDILPLPDGRVLLALGDVAGKGSPASLLMALLLAMMRTLVDEGFEGAALAARLNAQIVKHAPTSRFVTLFFGVLNTATGEFGYVNAGQNPPLLRRANGSYEQLKTGGIALGMFEFARYEFGLTTLNIGDVIVMYSDGVTEAEDGAGVPFDEDGLRGVVDGGRWASAKELAWAAFAAVDNHSQQRRLLDDLTILAIRRLPPLPA